MSESEQDEYVSVARVLRSRGNRGEVAADDWTDSADRFGDGARFWLLDPSGRRTEAVLEHAWYHQGRLILKFAGVDTISQAELLRGCEVQIPRGELGPPPEGSYYFEDLIGSRIVEDAGGREIGEVEDVLEGSGQPVLQVRSGEREILIPFVKSICVAIEPEKQEIRVRMPEGLEDLNS